MGADGNSVIETPQGIKDCKMIIHTRKDLIEARMHTAYSLAQRGIKIIVKQTYDGNEFVPVEIMKRGMIYYANRVPVPERVALTACGCGLGVMV